MSGSDTPYRTAGTLQPPTWLRHKDNVWQAHIAGLSCTVMRLGQGPVGYISMVGIGDRWTIESPCYVWSLEEAQIAAEEQARRWAAMCAAADQLVVLRAELARAQVELAACRKELVRGQHLEEDLGGGEGEHAKPNR